MLRTSQVLAHSAFQLEGVTQHNKPFASYLLSRKLAILVDGKLRSNAATYKALKRLQRKLRRRKPAKSETGILKNNAWTGSVLLQLGELVSTAIRDGRDCKDLEVKKGLYSALRARSNQDLSIGQFEYGLSIFSEAESASDVYEIMAGHRSYGDWWRQLGEEVRQRILEERRRAFVAFMAALTPEEKKARRRQLCDELLSDIPEIAPEIAPALERSSADISTELRLAIDQGYFLRSLDKAALPGQTFEFAGVPERMRSSWEALLALVIRAQPNRGYVYEPMPFPMVDPKSGRVHTYHPDFLDIKYRGTGARKRLIEVKGFLTETGQQKIAQFRRLYIRGDFSGYTPKQESLARVLVERTRKLAWKYFRLRLDSEDQFVVFGDLPWDSTRENFVQTEIQDNPFVGMIPRLRRSFPQFVSNRPGGSISNAKRKELCRTITNAESALKLVTAENRSHFRIGTSDLVAYSAETQFATYYLAHVVASATLEVTPDQKISLEKVRNYLFCFGQNLHSHHRTSESDLRKVIAILQEFATDSERQWILAPVFAFFELLERDLTGTYESSEKESSADLEVGLQLLTNVRDFRARLRQVYDINLESARPTSYQAVLRRWMLKIIAGAKTICDRVSEGHKRGIPALSANGLYFDSTHVMNQICNHIKEGKFSRFLDDVADSKFQASSFLITPYPDRGPTPFSLN